MEESVTFEPIDADAYGRAYPRPQLVRGNWISLNGDWEFAIDPTGRWQLPSDVTWDRRIRVPFSPEAPASGIGDTSFFRACWYRRTVRLGPTPPRCGSCCTSAPSTTTRRSG